MPTEVFESMGTVVSLQFNGKRPTSGLMQRVRRSFDALDERYSLYKSDSELSRIASGSLPLQDASLHVLDTYSLANDWRTRTGGAFTAHRPDGVLDLSGVVKAMAIDAAARELEFAGFDDWILNAGGDITIGSAARSTPWIVGIVDPDDRTGLLTSVALIGSRRACATSGSAERGDHIWAVHSAAKFAQVSVIADDIITADVLATAIVSGGPETLDLACRSWPVDVIAIGGDEGIRMTPGAIEAMHGARGFTATTPA